MLLNTTTKDNTNSSIGSKVAIGCFIFSLIILGYLIHSPKVSTDFHYPPTNAPYDHVASSAKVYMNSFTSALMARDSAEALEQARLLKVWKENDLKRNTKQSSESFYSYYTPTPRMVPSGGALLTQSGVCLPVLNDNVCVKCPPTEEACRATGYAAEFECTQATGYLDTFIKGADESVATTNQAPIGAPLRIKISCEYAYVDGRQAFWVLMAVCSAGAFLASIWLKYRFDLAQSNMWKKMKRNSE